MRRHGFIAALGFGLWASLAVAGPQHAISMYGDPALPADFAHLPYADPAAPKGGRIVFGEIGTFDSLNPFILKGTPATGLRGTVFESLMGRSIDEPFTLYGLLAESIETDAARSFVAFTLREGARFSDGSPVTVEDVLWSFETLGQKGLPNFASVSKRVAKMEATGPRSLRLTFVAPDRELPLLIGLRPVLKKADWEGVDFAASSLRVPVGSGPYRVGAVEPGRTLSLIRNPDYWGRDLPLNRGQHNLDEIRFEYFRDTAARFEAFRAGDLSVLRETDAKQWATAYDFPAVREGRVVQARIPHQRPTGMRGFVFNTRRPLFADLRVRQALTRAFNFDWINAKLNEGAFRRIPSYFGNSALGFDGPAEGAEAALLAPFADSLAPGALGADPPVPGDVAGRNRAALRQATALLTEAGWTVRDGELRDAAGTPFRFELLLRPSDDEALASIFADALKQLGITVTVKLSDEAQYTARRNTYDYDMIVNLWALSLRPGAEQEFYWGSAGRTKEGTRNYMGIESKAADAMIAALIAAQDEAGFRAAVRALDRVLTTGRYVIPFWYAPESWLAHDAGLKRPGRVPVYGDWPGYLPEVWWRG